MSDFQLDGKYEGMLSRMQDTDLSPMEEALFKSWARANQITKPDEPEDRIDYRGIYKATNGQVLPHGELKRFTEKANNEAKLETLLRQKMEDRIKEVVDSQQDRKDQAHKEQRQDVTHKQKIEMEGMKLKRAPIDLKMKEHDIKAKEMDVEKQHIGLDAQKLANEGKQLEITHSLVAPKPVSGATSAAGQTSKSASGQK